MRAFLVFAALIFVALGSWQVQRLFWKLDLIARVDARVHATPVAPPAAGQSPDDTEYLHVALTGSFDHTKETLVQAVTKLGPGYWVVTPLKLEDGRTILINRGFVPPDKRDPATRAESQTGGEAAVTGLVRLSEPGGGFLRENDPGNERWYSRDVDAIASSRDIQGVMPYFIDADATANPGGYPVGGLTVIQFPNSHLSYAFTWFVLALMSLGAAIFFGRLQRAAG
jgi:surfeit locus 1 family protein